MTWRDRHARPRPAEPLPGTCHGKSAADSASHGASPIASGRSKIVMMTSSRKYITAVARMMPVCACISVDGSARTRRASTTVVAVEE